MTTAPAWSEARMSRSDRTLIRRRLSHADGSSRGHPGAGSGLARVELRADLLVEAVDLALEVLEVLEALIDAREPDVGDLVELAELGHRELPDARARDFQHALGAELRLDLVGGLLGCAIGNRPPRQG